MRAASISMIWRKAGAVTCVGARRRGLRLHPRPGGRPKPRQKRREASPRNASPNCWRSSS